MRRIGDLMILESDLLPVSLKHAFTTRRISGQILPSAKNQTDQDKNRPNFRIDSIEETCGWWIKLRDSLFTPRHICCLHNQVHGGVVRVIDLEDPPGEELDVSGFRYRIPGNGDGIIKPFGRKRIFLAITTADCLPCIVFEPESGAVAVIHAGWRGLAADIPGNAIREFKARLGIDPFKLFWAIGPSIDMANYEVGTEVIAALETAGYADSDWRDNPDTSPGWHRSKQRDHFMLDLAACIRIRLSSMGVPPDQIDTCTLSTFGNPNLFYSFRRDGEIKGLQACVVG